MKSFCQKLCCCFARPRPSTVSNTSKEALIPNSNPEKQSNDSKKDIFIDNPPKVNNENNKQIIEEYLNDDPSYSEPCFQDKRLREEEKGLIPMVRRLNYSID